MTKKVIECDNPALKRHIKMICPNYGKPYWKWHWREHYNKGEK